MRLNQKPTSEDLGKYVPLINPLKSSLGTYLFLTLLRGVMREGAYLRHMGLFNSKQNVLLVSKKGRHRIRLCLSTSCFGLRQRLSNIEIQVEKLRSCSQRPKANLNFQLVNKTYGSVHMAHYIRGYITKFNTVYHLLSRLYGTRRRGGLNNFLSQKTYRRFTTSWQNRTFLFCPMLSLTLFSLFYVTIFGFWIISPDLFNNYR